MSRIELSPALSQPAAVGAEYALTGPHGPHDPSRVPARGDLAHIRLAGKVFVPHYAVPTMMRLTRAAPLQKAARPDADVLAEVPAGTLFAVLDATSQWVWGQACPGGPDDQTGPVGYCARGALDQ